MPVLIAVSRRYFGGKRRRKRGCFVVDRGRFSHRIFIIFNFCCLAGYEKEKYPGIYFLHLGNDGTDVSGSTDPLQAAADGLRGNWKERGRDNGGYGVTKPGIVP